MPRNRDYIPANANQFHAFMLHLIEYINANKTAWGFPQGRITELMDLFDAFSTALEAASGPATSAQILARNEAQAAAVSAVRAFVNQFLRFPPVTNVDRVEMGIPNHDTIRTDHFVVTEIVDFVIHLSAIRELVVDFWIQGTDHKAKPNGYEGAVIIWGLADSPPDSPEELENHTMASRRPFTLFFDETERGKTVFVALAWQNERGIRGAWSEYKSAIIP